MINIKTLLNSNAAMAAVVVGGGLVLVAFAAYKAESAAGEIVQAINPVNQDNIFASGVNAVGAKLSSNNNWSLGGWIYDITHDDS